MASLTLHVLGVPRLLAGDREIAVERRKALALLAYVGVSGQRQTREGLATLLWPDYERKAAFAYLRQTLWRLKRQLPSDLFISDRQTVQIKQLRVDAVAFQQILRECSQDTAISDDGCTRRLEAALKLYAGDFMSGFSLEDSAEFDKWQLLQTENLRYLHLQAHERLVAAYAAQQAYESAIWQARQWLSLDPLIEQAHRSLMWLFTTTGRRHLALQQYEQCRYLLKQELGVDPNPETMQLYQSIYHHKAQHVLHYP